MRLAFDARERKVGVLAAAIGLAAISLAGGTLVASLNGEPRSLFAVQAPPPSGLPVGEDVAGWASLDRDSMHVGQIATLTVRLLYRDGVVEPDLDTLRRSVGAGRFSSVGSYEIKRPAAPGLSEVILDYRLQGISVLPHHTYQIDPIVLFYKSAVSNAGELQKLRVATPTVHISGYYPEDVIGLSVKPPRGAIHDPAGLRQTIMIGCGLLLASIAAGLAWRFGRARRINELSDAERLWLDCEAYATRQDARADLLFYEGLFARLRQACTSAAAEAFWIGEDPDDPFWRDASQRARAILGANYRVAEAQSEDASAMRALLAETFAAVVAEERLKREREPSFLHRMMSQPLPTALSGSCAVLSLLLFALGAAPTIWLSPQIASYNAIVEVGRSAQSANDLFDLAQQTDIAELKMAALYNSGTILALLDPLNDHLIAGPLEIVERFKDAASLELVVKSQTTLALALERLRGAVAFDPRDEEAGRNLELIGKRHRIVVAVLIELIKMQEERVAEMQDLRTLLDALNMVLHDDARDNERAQKPDYYIGEKF